jgi:hypothetical protein
LMEKSEGKRPLWRLRLRWVNNIKMDQEYDGVVWAGSFWFRIGINWGRFWTWQWTVGFHKIWNISWVAGPLLASQGDLNSMALVC